MPLTSISAFKKSHRLENSVCRCSFHHVLERCWWKKRFNGAVSIFCWVTESNYRIHEHQRSLNYSLINELLANPWRGLVVAERGELDWSAQLHTRYTYTEAWTFVFTTLECSWSSMTEHGESTFWWIYLEIIYWTCKPWLKFPKQVRGHSLVHLQVLPRLTAIRGSYAGVTRTVIQQKMRKYWKVLLRDHSAMERTWNTESETWISVLETTMDYLLWLQEVDSHSIQTYKMIMLIKRNMILTCRIVLRIWEDILKSNFMNNNKNHFINKYCFLINALPVWFFYLL